MHPSSCTPCTPSCLLSIPLTHSSARPGGPRTLSRSRRSCQLLPHPCNIPSLVPKGHKPPCSMMTWEGWSSGRGMQPLAFTRRQSTRRRATGAGCPSAHPACSASSSRAISAFFGHDGTFGRLEMWLAVTACCGRALTSPCSLSCSASSVASMAHVGFNAAIPNRVQSTLHASPAAARPACKPSCFPDGSMQPDPTRGTRRQCAHTAPLSERVQ